MHGAWHGAWCWERVTPLLRDAGYQVHTPVLPGQGERIAEISTAITLNTHIDSVVSYLDVHQLNNVVLVGHSYGGAVISGVADRAAPRLRQLVYLDALVFDNGQSLASLSGPAAWATRMKAVEQAGRGVGLPPGTPESFGVTDPQDRDWVAAKLTLQPVNTFATPLILQHPLGNALPKVYIDCNAPAMASVNSFKSKVRQQSGWTYDTLASGHDAMVIVPKPLSAMLVKYA